MLRGGEHEGGGLGGGILASRESSLTISALSILLLLSGSLGVGGLRGGGLGANGGLARLNLRHCGLVCSIGNALAKVSSR